jgi:hypothetical protein
MVARLPTLETRESFLDGGVVELAGDAPLIDEQFRWGLQSLALQSLPWCSGLEAFWRTNLEARELAMRNRRAMLLTIACLALASCVLSFAREPHHFQNGQLLDVGSDERLFEGTTVIHAVYQVQIGELIYFARGERVRRYSGDPTHGLVVGDPVQVAIDGDNLILQRPDGKEIKAKVIRRQRAEAK